VQRLFSTFPNGWPGRALLLLRLVAAAPLLLGSFSFIGGFSHSSLAIELPCLASAVLLAVGFCTPFAALLQAVLEAWMAFQSDRILGEHAILTALGIGLAMLGPGAWSVDARLFGRKRIELRPDSD